MKNECAQALCEAAVILPGWASCTVRVLTCVVRAPYLDAEAHRDGYLPLPRHARRGDPRRRPVVAGAGQDRVRPVAGRHRHPARQFHVLFPDRDLPLDQRRAQLDPVAGEPLSKSAGPALLGSRITCGCAAFHPGYGFLATPGIHLLLVVILLLPSTRCFLAN